MDELEVSLLGDGNATGQRSTDGCRSGQHEAEECSNFRKDGLGLGNAGWEVSEDG